MRWLPRASIVAAVVLVVAGAGGCDPGGSDPSPPPTVDASSPASSATPTPTPTLTPTPSPTPTEVDEEEAPRQALIRYFEVLNRIAMDPDGDPDDLAAVAAGAQLELDRATLEMMRSRGWVATNPIQVRNIEAVSLTSDKLTIEFALCTDSTQVDLVDSNGESQIDTSAPAVFDKLMTVTSADSGATWFVVNERDGGSACDG